jgi:methylmalonyl-CoA/ethylmalonyl-CoA epimerase
MIIDHIGIAVRSLDQAIRQWETVFAYRRMTEPVVNTRQKVRVVFLQKEGSISVKLIEPTDETSPIFDFAKRGGGLHHLCFKCESLSGEMERMKVLGLRVLAAPQPGEAFENEDIAFVYAGHGLNIELVDTDKRAARLPV